MRSHERLDEKQPSAPRVGSLKTIWSHFNPLYHSFTVNQGKVFFLMVSVHVHLQYGCICANVNASAQRGDVFPIVIALCCNIS